MLYKPYSAENHCKPVTICPQVTFLGLINCMTSTCIIFIYLTVVIALETREFKMHLHVSKMTSSWEIYLFKYKL